MRSERRLGNSIVSSGSARLLRRSLALPPSPLLPIGTMLKAKVLFEQPPGYLNVWSCVRPLGKGFRHGRHLDRFDAQRVVLIQR